MQILVPVFPGGNRQVNVPIVPRKFGHLQIPVISTSFVAGHTVNHHVYVEVSVTLYLPSRASAFVCLCLYFYSYAAHLLQHYGVKEHYVTNYQVDLTRSNSETLPDLYIPVEEEYITPEKRLQNYVPGSPRSKAYVIGQ